MDKFSFFNRKREISTFNNIYIGGPEIDLMTESQIFGGLRGIIESKNVVKSGDTFSAQARYTRQGSSALLPENYWRSREDIDYFIIDKESPSIINQVQGFEFFGTTVSYLYLPSLYNGMGRQSFQNTLWEKIAYLPIVTNIGSNCFTLCGAGSFNTKIYIPNAVSIVSNPFRFGNTFNGVTMYMNSVFQDAVDNDTDVYLNTFRNKGGTVVIINNKIKPTAPSNLQISNITSNSFDISFNASSSSNDIEDYEIFCTNQNDPPSIYFYHKQLTTTSGTVGDLQPNTEYKIKVRGTDIYYNLSDFTTEEIITTTS
jgi:hypothetical protein